MTASSELPEGWTLAPIGDLAKFINGDRGKNYPNREALVPEGVPFVNAGHIIDDSIDFSNVNYIPEERFEILRSGKIQKDDLLYCIRGSLGKCAAVDQDVRGAIASSLVILRPKGSVAREYLRYCFKGPTGNKMIEALDNSTAQPNISAKSMAKYKVPVAPLNEQRRIVAKIEELTARSRNAKQALDAIPPLLERFRQSVLAAAFRGDLTKSWREQNPNTEPASELLNRIRQERRHRWEQDYLQTQKAKGKQPKNDKWKEKYQEPEPVDTTDLPELPEGWCWVSVDVVCFVTKLAGFEFTKYVEYDPQGDLPVIKAENVGKHGFRPTEFSRVNSESVEHLLRSKLDPGDVLVVYVGAGLGQVATVPTDQRYFLAPNVAKVRVLSSFLDNAFLESFLRSPVGFSQMTGSSKATAQPSLSMTKLRTVAVPVPPLAEQRKISEAAMELIESIERATEAQAESYAKLERLNQSILAKAFRGELVPQDPNDEPASALLERIRSQQNTSAKR